MTRLEQNLGKAIIEENCTYNMVTNIREVAQILCDNLAVGDHAFWLHVDNTELQKAFKILEKQVNAFEDERGMEAIP